MHSASRRYWRNNSTSRSTPPLLDATGDQMRELFQTMEQEVTLEGADMDFYSDANGRHQLTPFGTRYVTSSKQGWAFEADETGKIVSSFVNTIDISGGMALHLSEAWRFKENYFDEQFWLKCGGG